MILEEIKNPSDFMPDLWLVLTLLRAAWVPLEVVYFPLKCNFMQSGGFMALLDGLTNCIPNRQLPYHGRLQTAERWLARAC